MSTWTQVAHWEDNSGWYAIDMDTERAQMRTRYAPDDDGEVQQISRDPEHDVLAASPEVLWQTPEFGLYDDETIILSGQAYRIAD